MGQWVWLVQCPAGQLMVAGNMLMYRLQEQNLQEIADYKMNNGLHDQPPPADQRRGGVEGHSNQDQQQVGLKEEADGGWRLV